MWGRTEIEAAGAESRGWLVGLGAVVASLALALPAGAPHGGSSVAGTAVTGKPAAAAITKHSVRHGLESLPPVVGSQLSAAVGAESPRFHARPAEGGFRLEAAGVTARFDGRGATLRAGGVSLPLTVAGFGRGASLERPAVRSVGGHRNRVSLDRGVLTEWYAGGPLGIEQGFTVAQRPAGEDGPITLELALGGGVQARKAPSGGVRLTRADRPGLSYGALAALDATGRELPSALHVRDGALVIQVWDRGGRYPVVIDPLFQQGSKLTASGATGAGALGFEVALSADGNTALVGAPLDDSAVGGAWVFTRSGATWTQQGSKLLGTGRVGEGFVGWSVALSADGNTALVGGPADNNFAGAAWVFTRSNGNWTQQGPKLTGTGATGQGFFGGSAALSADGNTAVVGGSEDGSRVGAVWFFTRSGATWSQQGPKKTGGGEVGAGSFGFASALSADGDTALVGGPDDNGGVGAAWVLTRSAGTWTQQGSKLTGSGVVGSAFFGGSVALSADGNTALVGGSDDNGLAGAAWAFTRSGTAWTQQGPKLGVSGAVGAASVGYDVALSSDGNVALLGGPYDANEFGAAWLFTRSGGTWTQDGAKLTGSGASGSAFFGNSVALSSDGATGLIGGQDDANGVGAVWPFAAPVPAAPTGVTAVAGDGTATVSFTPPPGVVTTYTVHATPADVAPVSGTSSPIVVTGLTNGTAYTFQVQGSNSTGTGQLSAPSNSVTPFGTPGAPTGVAAAAGDGYALVSFTPPAATGGVPIAYYTVTASPGGQVANGSGSPIRIDGLTNGVAYTFTVTATNTGPATSPASSPSAQVTPAGGSRPHTLPTSESPRPPIPVFPVPTTPRVPPP
jgi:hypothetical protein